MKTKCGSTLSAEIVLILINLVLLSDCRRMCYPEMVDTLGTELDSLVFTTDGNPWELAPFVVVATVEENRITAKHIEPAHYQGVYLDLHAVRCKRENSIQGSLSQSELTFFYYASGSYPDSKPLPGHERPFHAAVGLRYVFFLTRDRDRLRAVGDFGYYSIRVLSGRHDESSADSKDPGRRLAEILLTPGNGADTEGMANSLLHSAEFANVWCSRSVTAERLRHLLSLGEPLRLEACGVLVEDYHGQEDCLQAMADDPNESVHNRQLAMQILKEKSNEYRRVVEDLKDPAHLGFQDFAGDSRHRLREEFETLLFNPDPILHERACAALKRYFPWDAEPRCSGNKKVKDL